LSVAYSHQKITFDIVTNAYSSEIFGDLDRIASTPYGINLLNRGVIGPSYIRIAGLEPNQIGQGPAFGAKKGVPLVPTINIDYPGAQQVYWFNNKGEMILGSVTLVIAHELAHAVDDAKDPVVLDPSTGTYVLPSDEQMNAASFDFKGGAVKAQNSIATQLRLSDQKRASYMAATFQNTTYAGYTFTLGKSYTDGATVNIVRFGDQQGAGQANDIDHSARIDNSKDLIFALAGDDYVDGGGGIDNDRRILAVREGQCREAVDEDVGVGLLWRVARCSVPAACGRALRVGLPHPKTVLERDSCFEPDP
jgi:hypothetical protein